MLRLAITDRHLIHPSGEHPETELATRCAALAAHGVDYLLIREKDLEAGDLVTLSRGIVSAVRTANPATKILIARRPDVVLAVRADGVHLSAASGELTPAQVRRIIPDAFVSISCHTLEEVLQARDNGASAILFGPVFGKVVEGVEVVKSVGLEKLQQACQAAGEMPVFALGGIDQENARECVAAGSAGIAGIRLFFGSSRI